jgi:hypothetical protein
VRDIDLVPESTAIPVDEHRYRLAVALNSLIKEAIPAQDDSAATTVTEIRDDFNAFLQKLRDLGVMEP